MGAASCSLISSRDLGATLSSLPHCIAAHNKPKVEPGEEGPFTHRTWRVQGHQQLCGNLHQVQRRHVSPDAPASFLQLQRKQDSGTTLNTSAPSALRKASYGHKLQLRSDPAVPFFATQLTQECRLSHDSAKLNGLLARQKPCKSCLLSGVGACPCR